MRRILFAILSIIICASTFNGCGGSDYITYEVTAESQQEQINWHEYSQTLFLTARYAKRPVLLYFHLDNCHGCDMMEEETFSNKEIVHLINTSYIPIKVHASEDQFFDVAEKFGLIDNGLAVFPSVIILSSTNNPKELLKSSGFAEPSAFKVVLETLLAVDELMRLEDQLDKLLEQISQSEKLQTL